MGVRLKRRFTIARKFIGRRIMRRRRSSLGALPNYDNNVTSTSLCDDEIDSTGLIMTTSSTRQIRGISRSMTSPNSIYSTARLINTDCSDDAAPGQSPSPSNTGASSPADKYRIVDAFVTDHHQQLASCSNTLNCSELHFECEECTCSEIRNQGEVGHTCRGSINLQGAFIHTDDAYRFIVSNGGTQTFHLKLSTETERQKWVTALELARVRAIKAAESDEEEELKLTEEEGITPGKGELQTALKSLQAKLEDLTTCQDMIVKHGTSLQAALTKFEHVQHQEEQQTNNGGGVASDMQNKIKTVNERAMLFRITTNAMMNACGEFVALSLSHGRKWHRLLQHEHDQRLQLQKTLEELARQHGALERAAVHQAKEQGMNAPTSVISSDDEGDFEDAIENMDEFDSYTSRLGRQSVHRRTGSQASLGTMQDDDDMRVRRPPGPADGWSQAQFVVSTDAVVPAVPSPTEEDQFEESKLPIRKRRIKIPSKANVSVSLWSIMKNCIGKELSKIPMPVNFNEPLSMLQRLTEDLEYSSILDRGRDCTDTCEQLAYVAAFTVSSYSTTATRTGKPFNPLLGETFECDRTDDMGWRSVAEQVSHHPPAAALYCEGRGWTMWQEFTMSSKFRGKYLQIIPLGISHLEFKDSGNHYTWRKVTTTVNNIILGRLWIDNHGEMSIENHKTGDTCHLKYIPYSYFSRDTPRKVTGVVTNKLGDVKWVIQGTWDDSIDIAKVVSTPEGGSGGTSTKPVYVTEPPKTVWKRNPPLPSCEEMFFFTKLAVQLNESESGMAPTDSRLRPDQRSMENGDFDSANTEKHRLEEKQRIARRQREAEAELAIQEGRPYQDYEAVWFKKQTDPWTQNLIHMYQGNLREW